MSETENGFFFYDRPQEFDVTVRIEGTMTLTIAAEDAASARAKAQKMIEAEDFDAEVHDLDDASVSYVWRVPTRMYLVEAPDRPGSNVSTSRPSSTDKPRLPSESDTKTCLSMGYRASWLVAREATHG